MAMAFSEFADGIEARAQAADVRHATSTSALLDKARHGLYANNLVARCLPRTGFSASSSRSTAVTALPRPCAKPSFSPGTIS